MDRIENSLQKEIDLSGIRYVILDWDGTVVDSMPVYIKTFSSILKKQFNILEDQSEQFFTGEAGGKALSYQFKEGIRRFANVDIQDSENLESIFWDLLKDQSPSLIVGIKELLIELRRRNMFIISWSGSPGDINQSVAERVGLSDFFDLITGSERGSSTKVKGQELFEDIAKHFGISSVDLARQSLVVGDMKGDVDAGLQVGAITAGFGDPKDPKFKDADFVFQTHQELLDMLGQTSTH